MSFLFDRDAISELLRPRPLPSYLDWLSSVPRDIQYTSSVVIGELYKGAYRSKARERHLLNIENRVLPCITVLPYGVATAKVFGRIRAELEEKGKVLDDADLQIAATAIHHGLVLVTGNIRHFSRLTDLQLSRALADARKPHH